MTTRPAVLLASLATLCALILGTTGPAAAAPERSAPTAGASVVGGKPAWPGRFPWMAFVVFETGKGQGSCTGSVVAPNVILTAAHCVVQGTATRPAARFTVVTGVVDISSEERQVSAVGKVIPFPGFERSQRSQRYGDAALLVLETPTTAPSIRLSTNPARLRIGATAYVAGWGETVYGQKGPTMALVWAKTMISSNRCEGFRGRVCVIDFPNFTAGVCHGDSGGPLLARSKSGKDYVQIGVTQAGYGECSPRRPQIFLRADLIAPWVASWVGRLSPEPPTTEPPAGL